MFARARAGQFAERRRLGDAIQKLGRAAMVGLMVALGIVSASGSEAATISTYAFFQGGYANPGNFAGSATVQGRFTGAVEPNGLMNAAGLTAFELTMTINQSIGSLSFHSIGLPSFLSFDTFSSPNPSGGNSTFALAVAMDSPNASTLCIGVATPFICGVTANGGLTTYDLRTMDFAKLTLVPTITPIPAPVLLFGTALAGLGLLGLRRRQRDA